MSGTIPLSMTQQMDQYGDPLSGGLLYFFVAGTVSTTQNAFKDSGLTLPHPNPITLDATGRVPQLFLADGLIKIRLTDSHGVVQLVADNVQVIGASSGGGGGGGTIDVTTIYQTGDMKPRYGVGSHSGWVRSNGRTIGSSISGATERQNNDTQALFEYLWNADTTLAVIPSRGANANADWLANRQMTLPDLRGRVLAGMDDMGGLAANRLTAANFGVAATALGAAGGTEAQALTHAQLPAATLTTTIPAGEGSHNHTGTTTAAVFAGTAAGGGGGIGAAGGTGAITVNANTLPAMSGTTALGGSGVAHNNVQHTIVATWYLKL